MFSITNNLLSRVLPYNAYRFLTRHVHAALRTGRYYDDGLRLDFFGYAFRRSCSTASTATTWSSAARHS